VSQNRAGADPVEAPVPAAELPADQRDGEAKTPQSASIARPTAPATSNGLSQLTRILGGIVAPTTLLTALLFYFGYTHAYWYFDYFGVNSTLLGLTTRDYVQRSVDGLFVPLTVTACVALAVLWGHAVLRTRLAASSHARTLRSLAAVMAAGGLVLATAGFTSIFANTVLDNYIAVAPLSLAAGVLVLMYAVHLWRSLTAKDQPGSRATTQEWGTVVEWAGVFVLVGLSLFWAANDYSFAVGQSRARQFVTEMPRYPSAVLYSARSLSLAIPGVREVRCQHPEAAYRFRYDGLKLLLQSGDQYVFLPEKWSRTNGVAIVIPRGESLRLEFLPSSARRGIQRSTC
jgi:hypothetical protein